MTTTDVYPGKDLLFAGSALDQTEQLNRIAAKRDARDAYYASARVRLSF